MASDTRFDVFLSHNSMDKPSVRLVAKALEARQLRTWFDEDQLIPGRPWQEALEEVISKCRSVAVLVGGDGLGPWQNREMRSCISQFVDRGLPVIPVLLPGAPAEPELPVFLRDFTWVDLRNGLDPGGVDRLTWGITGTRTVFVPNHQSRNLSAEAISPSPFHDSPPGELFGVPELPAHYLFRGQLHERVVAALLHTGTSHDQQETFRLIGLIGMGGVGKTVTASAIARDDRLRRQFTDGIFWLTVGLQPDIQNLQFRLARQVGGSRVCQDSQEWRHHLSRLFADKRCLLILDDAWRAEQVREFEVLGPASRLVLTTREGAVLTALAAEELALDVMSDGESLRLLSDWCGETLSERHEHAVEVANECGNLPLALAVCGAMVRDGIRWVDILEALRDADLSFLEHADLLYTYPSIFRALKASVDFLSSQWGGADRRYLELGAFPKDTKIPESAVLAMWCGDGEMKERDARKLLATMARKALLAVTGTPPNCMITMHDLQHDFIHGQYEG